MEMSDMSPRRPYLLRAFYEWLIDNQLTHIWLWMLPVLVFQCRWSLPVMGRLY